MAGCGRRRSHVDNHTIPKSFYGQDAFSWTLMAETESRKTKQAQQLFSEVWQTFVWGESMISHSFTSGKRCLGFAVGTLGTQWRERRTRQDFQCITAWLALT